MTCLHLVLCLLPEYETYIKLYSQIRQIEVNFSFVIRLSTEGTIINQVGFEVTSYHKKRHLTMLEI